MQKTKLKEVINVAGSVASITGVSLLWLKNLNVHANLAIVIPFYIVASLLALGLLSLEYVLLDFGYGLISDRYAIPPTDVPVAGKLAYIGLVGGLALFIGGTAVTYIFFFAWSLAKDVAGSQIVP
jgi:hypothetical protein